MTTIEIQKKVPNPRPRRTGSPDDWSTPTHAIDLLVPHIPEHVHIIWEPCFGQGALGNYLLVKSKRALLTTDVDISETKSPHVGKHDFLKDKVPTEFTFGAIITNPPYSKKTEFIAKCIELKKPWALLLPLTTLEGVKRNPLFNKLGEDLSILIPKRRVKFRRFGWEGRESRPQFQVAWFTSGFDFPKQINFEE